MKYTSEAIYDSVTDIYQSFTMSSKEVVAVINYRRSNRELPAPCELVIDRSPILQSDEPSNDAIVHQSSTGEASHQSSNSASSSTLDQSRQPIDQCIKRKLIPCVQCLIESLPSSAITFCLTCVQWLCVDHARLHDRMADRLEHKTHSVEEYINNATVGNLIKQTSLRTSKFPRYVCALHDLKLELFCVDCQQFICVRCQFNHPIGSQTVMSSYHSNHTCQSLIEGWSHVSDVNDLINQSAQTIQTIDSLSNQLVSNLDLIQRTQSDALSKLHQSIVRLDSVNQKLQQNMQKITKKARSLLANHRSTLSNRKSIFRELQNKLNLSNEQLISHSSKLTFLDLQQSMHALHHLLIDQQKHLDRFKMPRSHHLLVSLEQGLLYSLEQPNDPDIAQTIASCAQTLITVISNWLSIELMFPSDRQIVPLLGQHRQSSEYSMAQSNSELNSESNNQSISQSTDQSDPEPPHPVFDPATHCDQSTNLSSSNNDTVDQSNNQLQVCPPDFFGNLCAVDEPQVPTWPEVLCRIRQLEHDQSISWRAATGVARDLCTLCMDPHVYMVELEDVDFDTVNWFARTFVVNQSMSSFASTADAIVHLLVYYHDRMPTGDMMTDYQILTAMIHKQSPFWPWRVKLNWALCLFQPDDMSKDGDKTVSHIVVDCESMAAAIIPNLRYAPETQALLISSEIDDQIAQKLSAVYKYLTGLKNLICCLGDTVSQATTTALLRSIGQNGRSLISLTMTGWNYDERLVLASTFKNLQSLALLHVCELTATDLTVLSTSLRYLPSLTSLEMSECDFDGNTCLALTSSLPLLPKLTRITIYISSIHHCVESERLISCIGSLVRLTSFTFSHCEILPVWNLCLTDALKRLSNLQRLDLSCNSKLNPNLEPLAGAFPGLRFLDLRQVGALDGHHLAAMLKTCPALIVLRLDSTQISSPSQVFLSLSHCPSLVELSITNILIDPGAAVALSLQFRRLNKLVKLDISGACIDKKPGLVVARNLQYLTQLEHLNISSNKMASQELRDSLQKMLFLRYLNIAKISLLSNQCEMFAESFDNLGSTLEYLDFSSNRLSAKGLLAMGDAFTLLHKLRTLVYKDGGMNFIHVEILIKMLEFFEWLKVLNLSNNQLGDPGVSSITKKIRENNKFINTLILNNCSFGDRGLRAIRMLCESHLPLLRQLNLIGNKYSEAEASRLSEVTGIRALTDYS